MPKELTDGMRRYYNSDLNISRHFQIDGKPTELINQAHFCLVRKVDLELLPFDESCCDDGIGFAPRRFHIQNSTAVTKFKLLPIAEVQTRI
jgi:hypothetical protein